jgi:hypothetical protein
VVAFKPRVGKCPRCQQDPCICIEIRASSLASMSCGRQWAVENDTLAPIFKKFGHEFRPDRDNPGSLCGSAAHEGLGAYMQGKIDGYAADPLPHAIRRFLKDTAELSIEAMEDKVTPNKDVALAQIELMLEHVMPVVKTIEPKKVEFRVEATVDAVKHIYVTGHPDCYETTGFIDDWKFGKNLSAYDAQLGAYSLMLRSQPEMEVTGLRVIHVPRRSIKSKLWGVEVLEYDKYHSEQLAEHLIYDAASRIEKFKETGDLFAFTPNPNHVLCSEKWCRAWKTSACDYGRPKKETNEGE